MRTRGKEYRQEPDSSNHWSSNGYDYVGPPSDYVDEVEKMERGTRAEQADRAAWKSRKDRNGRS